MSERLQFLEDILYPVARVRAKKGGGSGTVIYSQTDGKDFTKFNTYLVTNWHVIQPLIKVKKQYDSFLKRNMPVETRGIADIDFFRYSNGSRIEAVNSMKAKIEAYNEDEDLALLKLESTVKADNVAKMPPRSRESEIQLADRVFAVGAALGHQPLITSGMINYLDEEIDDRNYWLTSAPIIFGNSGGALFSAIQRELIGIPSRIELVAIGFGVSPITHLGFVTPFNRLYDWLDSEFYQFLYDPNYNIDECQVERDTARKDSQRLQDLLSLSNSE